MKKWLVFVLGIFAGIFLTLLTFILLAGNSVNNENITWFEKPGVVIDEESIQVVQVIDKNAALACAKVDDTDMYLGTAYLITNKEGKYYYDDEIIKVSDEKEFRQVGVYQYMNNSNVLKTVPVIMIMDKEK